MEKGFTGLLILITVLGIAVVAAVYFGKIDSEPKPEVVGSASPTGTELAPPKGPEGASRRGSPSPTQIGVARQVKARHEDALMKISGVVGTGLAVSPDTAEPVIQVYVVRLTDEVQRIVPTTLEGIRVQTVETGEIQAY